MDMTPHPSNILRAWQRIEFFQPYPLEKKDKSLRIPMSQLLRAGDNALPWLSAELRQLYEIPPKASFTLHIGLFEKSIANAISLRVFGPNEGHDEQECEQRLNQEGTTCFAKLQLDKEGAPIVDTFSVSSLPWALGHLDKQRFQQLESGIFAADCMHLANTFKNFSITLKPAREKGPRVLRASDILTLLTTHLTEWADFSPEWQCALQIDWFGGSRDTNVSPQEEESEEEESLSEGEKALALPILNSFYFEDLEKTIRTFHIEKPEALTAYLSQPVPRQTDLYSSEGLSAIIDKLHPDKMPMGRWPAEPEHAMSLMQQFAINTAIEELAEGGLLSVNGPPGTGKTTLLRDLVANNVVERAKILCEFNNVDATLDREGFIVSRLTGYEMIVASSNNAAVENISRELPQKKSLAEEFRSLDYLAPTANQIAAERLAKDAQKRGKNGEDKERDYHLFRPLEEEKQCWGLISAALGKKANREQFAQRLLINEHFLRKTPAEDARPANENFLTLWRWKELHRATSFAAAKMHFKDCLKQVEDLQNQLKTFANLLNKHSETSRETLLLNLAQTETLRAEYHEKLLQAEAERDVVAAQVQYSAQQLKALEENAPGWLSVLLKRQKYRTYQEQLRTLRQLQLTQTRELTQKTQHVAAQRECLNETEARKRSLQQDIEHIAHENQTLLALKKQFSGMALPDSGKAINDPDLQRRAFWQNADINRLRSRLFVAAIELHQAWLYEAMGIERFRNNIYRLGNFLSQPHLETRPLRWWQTLSMFVPVLSTTFASVGRMLQGVKGEELGWLMIDEAGQASPQQAVGAIWRAKRVLVVGDPLQIEPVFTASPALVKRLCQDVLHEHANDWDPATLSVQQIADRANRWGCELEVMNINIRVGIPLWVHRRCIEPMFSLANKMAYNNRMIHGLDAEKIRSQPVTAQLENHWLISAGGQGSKQYRDSHGISLLALIDLLLSEQVALQSIYVITPFKAVKSALSELIAQRSLKEWQRYAPLLKSKHINEWKKRGIGTVHTFQGKENDIVIFVLGCDEQNSGGAIWASSKPNLLNVALTRAKKHFFVIGDPRVWQSLSGFEDVAKILPQKRVPGVITLPESRVDVL
ncbi:AAA domain-containing protein [Enterobacter sp. BIGb0383]|uniref:DEAD/DEAH box helicase n=1 Tax=unclassified Enterobacter TaxID=2608935 RepID=UPI000F498B8C|nr:MULTISPECIES: ATP-binding protein [unclassified Enterobacter]ROP59996.1 AAA domain-containing protein [Enterobacter sp. BIGb0383]ROS08535.1 AAA domain-containing protein [Enterobacter sp. BIGb0359]